MIVTVASLLALVAAGYFPVRLLTGERYAPVLAAPIATAVMCTIAGMVCLVLRVSMVVAVVLVALFSIACAVLVMRGHRTPADFPTRRRSRAPFDSPAVFWVLLGGVIPFLTVLRAVGWDARSIWWFHAKWWAEGGGALVDAMRNPAFVFSHADYPPLASATNGALWALFGGRSLDQAQFVTAVLGLSAAAVLGHAVMRLFAGRLPGVVVAATAALLIAACYGLAGVDLGTNGYVDFLWSVAFAAAAVFLLASPRSEAALRWGSLMLAASMLTKNEALIAGIVLGALAVIRYRFGWRPLVWIATAAAPGVLWLVLTRVIGAYSDAIDQWRTSELLHLDHEVTTRIVPSLHAVADHLAYVRGCDRARHRSGRRAGLRRGHAT